MKRSRSLIKRLFSKLGFFFLKTAGEKHFLIKHNFFVPSTVKKGGAARMYAEGEVELFQKIKPFIHVSHKKDNTGMQVWLRIIIKWIN